MRDVDLKPIIGGDYNLFLANERRSQRYIDQSRAWCEPAVYVSGRRWEARFFRGEYSVFIQGK